MKSNLITAELGHSPVIIGAGHSALGIAISNQGPKARHTWTGGNSTNVIIVLSYLDWRAYPVTKLGADFASARGHKTLARMGVNVHFLSSQANSRLSGEAHEPC